MSRLVVPAVAAAATVLFLSAASLHAAPCVPSPTRLCLNGGRFATEVVWKDFAGNTGAGQAISLTGDTGYFWFFSSNNVELVVKVLDGRALNSNFWVFYGALSNVEYTMTVTDTVTGSVKRYVNPSGVFGSVGDTSAFPPTGAARESMHRLAAGAGVESLSASAALALRESLLPRDEESRRVEAATACTATATSLCLNGGRFRVGVAWKDFAGNTGTGTAVSLTGDTGYFWFFSSNNVELTVKVLDARALNDAFWVFYGALSNVEYTITVTDTATGQVKKYVNPAGNFGSTGDTSAFPQNLPAVKSSEQLIDEDLQAHAITDEQALVYRVYVAFGSPSLPAKYRSTAEPGIDLPIAKTVAKRYPTLSATAKAALDPYLHPPIYKGSWGDPDFVASIQPGAAGLESAAKSPARTTDAVCPTGTQPGPTPGWGQIHTQHFTVWYRVNIPNGYTYSAAETQTAATNIAAVADAVWDSLTANFHTVPISDVNESCNGGDASIDVYMEKVGFGALAQTMVYLPGCAARPTWMWINPLAIQDPVMARDVFAHEFMHMIECAYSRGGPCDDYAWLEEAAANWAIDYVYKDDQYEHPAAAQYYSSDYQVPIEQSLTYGANGYSDYVFLFYLSHKLGTEQGPATIRKIFEFAQLYDSFDSLDNATSASGGLKVLWPNFVTAGWNDWAGGVADEFHKWDSLEHGRKRFIDQYGTATNVDMKGLSQKIFDLSGSFLVPQSDGSVTIEPLGARYVDLKFPDTSARYVVFHNKPAELAPDHPHLHIRALQKINGTWRAEEDWTNAEFKTFCRDAKAERIEELVLMYSNSNPARPGFDSNGLDSSRIYLEDQNRNQFVPTVEVSNAGCWRWTGTASVTTQTVSGFTTVESATATFDRFRFPGENPEDTVGFDVFKSTNTGSATFSIDGPLTGTSCTIHGTASGPLRGDGELLADAGFIATFLQPGQVTNRTVIGSGTTHIDAATSTTTCSGQPPETTTGPQDVHWLRLPQTGALISNDGLFFLGQEVTTDSDGTKTAVWNMTAVREE